MLPILEPEEGVRCRRSTRMPVVFSSGPEMGLLVSSANLPPSRPPHRRHHRQPPWDSASTPRSSPSQSSAASPRFSRSAPTWTTSSALSPPKASVIFGKGETEVSSVDLDQSRMDAADIGAGGGSSLSEIYQNARRLLLRTRDGKIEQVGEEVDSLKESLEKLLLRQQKRMMEAKERAELLQRANGESEHVLRIFDEEAQAIQSARNSSMMLEEAYDTGVAVLSKYADQRDRLKRAQRKALDILNTVGLSNSVLKLIERRHRVDKWVAYGGMAATIILVFLFWRWTH